MPTISVELGGRSFEIACDTGKEKHVRELARYVEKHVQRLKTAGGRGTDINYLMLASLIVTDELTQTKADLDQALATLRLRETELENARAQGGETADGPGEQAYEAAVKQAEISAQAQKALQSELDLARTEIDGLKEKLRAAETALKTAETDLEAAKKNAGTVDSDLYSALERVADRIETVAAGLDAA